MVYARSRVGGKPGGRDDEWTEPIEEVDWADEWTEPIEEVDWADLFGAAVEGDVLATELPTALLLAGPAQGEQAREIAATIADLVHVDRGDLSRLSRLAHEHPDLAIVVGAPDLLGRVAGAISRAREELDERALPVIALGVATTEPELQRLLAAGANDSLQLPLRPGELRAKVRRALREREPEQKAPAIAGEVTIAGRYRLREALGSGGYGSVYEAWDLEASRPVAIKTVSARGPAARERFLREAYTLASVSDPHLAAVFDVREAGGHLLLVTELVQGLTLRHRVTDLGPLDDRELVGLLRGLGRALLALQRAGLVHRDIKPANVVLRRARADSPVLVDFGLTKRAQDRALTGSAVMLGTPGYMPPEVLVRGSVPDARADMFALGMLARYALVGQEYRPELSGLGLLQHMADVRVDIPPVGPEALTDVLLRLTEPDLASRLATAEELLRALDAIGAA